MTRLPADAFQIEPLRGDEYPDYRCASICALDGCSSLNVSVHHIVRRSWTVGPYSWVRIGETVVGNLIPLCFRHHNLISDDKARIIWDEDSKLFSWRNEDGSVLKLAQPPSLEAAQKPSEPSNGNGHHEHNPRCPTCHRTLPMPSQGNEKKRSRKTWTVTVPNDAREVGADVLDTLLESARLILDDRGLSYGEGRGVRYFTLATTLGLFTIHADEILSDS